MATASEVASAPWSSGSPVAVMDTPRGTMDTTDGADADLGMRNPLAQQPRATAAEGEHELRSALLTGGTWSQQQIEEMKQFVAASVDARTAAAEPERSRAHAHAEPNFHQAMVFYSTSKEPQDAAMHARAPLLLAVSWMIVILQCMVSAGVYKGTMFPSCRSNTMCGQGQFCLLGYAPRAGAPGWVQNFGVSKHSAHTKNLLTKLLLTECL